MARGPMLDLVRATMPARAFWPYDKATARAGLPIAGCSIWPEARPAPYADRDVITNRALLLSGEHDLYTVRQWAVEQADSMSRARLVRFPVAATACEAATPGAGSSVTSF